MQIDRGTRVEVATTQGSAYDGRRGTVTRVEDRTAFVAMETGPAVMPFGLTELMPLAGGLLGADFWERFAATKEPGEHMHTLDGGARVYCNRTDCQTCDDCGRIDGHNMEVEH